MTVHLVTYEHADHGLSRVRVESDENGASACFHDWVRTEEDGGEGERGAVSDANAFDPEGAVAVWRGDYGSRIIRFEVAE